MALDVSALGNYTKQNLEPLLMSALFSAETQDLIKKSGIVMTGVKGPQKMPILETNATFQTDACGWNPSGTTSFSQRDINVGKIMLQEAICAKTLETKFTVEALRAGSTYEDFGNAEFEQKWLERKMQIIAKQLETAIWQGDTTSLDENLNKFDGLIKLIDAGSPVSGGTPGAVNASTVIGIVKTAKNAIPAALKGAEDFTFFVGYDFYDLYVDAGVALNYFHYNFDDKSKYGGLKIPGTNISLKAVHGLDGTGDMYGMRLSNVALAVDAEAEENDFDVWYSKDNNELRFRCAFKMGTNVAFSTEVVAFKGTI